MLTEREADIRRAFSPTIGSTLNGYSTAELLLDDGTWEAWPDLPIRIEWGSTKLLAVAWSKFDDLWLAADTSLPFSVEGSTIRWVANSIDKINPVVGATIRSVLLGRGEMSIEGKDVEIWTRLVVETSSGWLEIFNALDENGYDFHTERPAGTFKRCI